MAPTTSLTKIVTLSSLLVCRTLASVNDITVNRGDLPDVVHSIYKALGENWQFSDDDDSPVITGLVMFDKKEDYDDWHQNNNYTRARVSSKLARSLDLHPLMRRAAYTTSDTTCVVAGSDEDQFWRTRAEQLASIQKFCKALNSVNAEAFFFIGLILSSAACDANLVCNAIIGVGALEAGKYVGPAFGKLCDKIYGTIPANCGNKGGTIHARTTSDGESYMVEAFETQESASLCASGDSTEECFHMKCGSSHCV